MKKLTPAVLKNTAIKTLKNHKAIDILAINVKKLTDITDYMIICTASSTTHSKTLIEKVSQQLALLHIKPLGIEGENSREWMLADFGDIIIHIMLEPIREFYNLEKLWSLNHTARNKNN